MKVGTAAGTRDASEVTKRWARALSTLRQLIRRARRASSSLLIERGLRDMDVRDGTTGLYRHVFEAAPVAMALTDGDFKIVAVNAALTSLIGGEADEICGQDLTALSAPPHPARLNLMAEKASLQDGPVVVEHRLTRRTGEGWARTSLKRLEGGGAGICLVAVVEDITRDQEALEQQRREAELDPLTGLLNRRGGDRRLRAALERMAQQGPVAVILCDADGFKEVNDRFGHAVGDEVLAGVAGRLRSAIRYGDDVARLGGDEFIVVAWVADEAEAGAIAYRCVSAVADPIRASHDEGPHRVTLSAGVAVARPGQSVEAETLLAAADQALYRAKAEGGNTWVVADF